MTPGRVLLGVRIAVVVAIAALLILAQQLGVFRQFSDPARAKQTLVALGPFGYLAFIGAYAALQPFGVPGTVFIMVAPLIWPWPVAFLLSLAGTMAASVVGFSCARFLARDFVAARIPARFQRYDEALARRALATVFLLRLVFWMPPMLHAFFGVSRVPFWLHFFGSLAGYVLPLLLMSYFGARLVGVMQTAPKSAWIVLGVLAAVIALLVVVGQRRGRRRRL